MDYSRKHQWMESIEIAIMMSIMPSTCYLFCGDDPDCMHQPYKIANLQVQQSIMRLTQIGLSKAWNKWCEALAVFRMVTANSYLYRECVPIHMKRVRETA